MNAKLAALSITASAVFALAIETPSTGQAKPAGDAASGGKVFATRCAMCHGKGGKGGPLAPSLLGVVGSKAAASNSPRNSAALKASKLVWTERNLDAFLLAPRKLVPGTNMAIAVPQPADRKNVIAYLTTLKK